MLSRQRNSASHMACFVETGQKRNPEGNGNVSAALVPNSPQLRILDVALAEDFSIRSLGPELRYMRGPGPKWREKRVRSAKFAT